MESYNIKDQLIQIFISYSWEHSQYSERARVQYCLEPELSTHNHKELQLSIYYGFFNRIILLFVSEFYLLLL